MINPGVTIAIVIAIVGVVESDDIERGVAVVPWVLTEPSVSSGAFALGVRSCRALRVWTASAFGAPPELLGLSAPATILV